LGALQNSAAATYPLILHRRGESRVWICRHFGDHLICPTRKEYIHRVGRTARAGKSGKYIAMVTQYDVEVYQRLKRFGYQAARTQGGRNSLGIVERER
jgi:hypothetical protein